MPRTAKPQISFADWELLQQGILLEPLLQGICDFLDDHEEMIEAVRRDLERGLKNPGTGRNGLTPQQVLRSLILKRVKNWDFRELRERIADGYTLRRRRCRPSMSWSCKRQWIWVWKMARNFAWTPRSYRPTFIIRPTTPCYGMSYAWSLVWSATSEKQSSSG